MAKLKPYTGVALFIALAIVTVVSVVAVISTSHPATTKPKCVAFEPKELLLPNPNCQK